MENLQGIGLSSDARRSDKFPVSRRATVGSRKLVACKVQPLAEARLNVMDAHRKAFLCFQVLRKLISDRHGGRDKLSWRLPATAVVSPIGIFTETADQKPQIALPGYQIRTSWSRP
jgi:hypothetical protein